MNLRVEIEWEYTGPDEESLEFSRVLYAYLHPDTNEILYIGKADCKWCKWGQVLH